MSADPAPQQAASPSALDRWPRWIQSLVRLRAAEKAYVLGSALLLLAVVVILLPIDDAPASILGWLGGLILTLALACEAYLLIVRFADAAWAKWLMVPILVMGGALAVGESAHLVNSATGQDPSLFPRATTFMVPIAALPMLGFVAIMLLGLGVLAFLFTWGSQLGSKDRARERRAWFWFARLMAALSAITFVSPTVEAKSSFHASVRAWAPRLVASLDMHVDPQCGPEATDRVKRINDELVVLARRTSNGLIFRRIACPLAPQPPPTTARAGCV